MKPRSDGTQMKPGDSLRYIAGVTVGFALYEAAKETFLPELSEWGSHAISILVVAVLSALFLLWFGRRARDQLPREKQLVQEIRESEERHALVLEVSNDGIWDWNFRTGEVVWNDHLFEIVGLSRSEVTPTLETLLGLVNPEDRQRVIDATTAALEGGERYEEKFRLRRPDGDYRTCVGRGKILRDENGEAYYMAGTITDITEGERVKEELRYWAFHDPLTDLPNRTLFMDRLEQALTRAQQRGSGEVATFFVDLDDLKAINDSLGHQAGDRLLVSVGQHLRALLQPGGTIAHFGGDEFVVLLEDTDADAARRVAQRLVEGMRTAFAVDGRELTITCSLGIALGGTAGERPDDLLRKADMALYEAKARGKNCYVAFETAMEARALERLETEHSLRQSTEQGEGLVLHYQPVVSLEDDRIVGFEALVRWNHPLRGLLQPAEFIGLAEQTGLIVGIGHWVLRDACCQAAQWQERYPIDPPLAVSVNLSASQLTHPDLPADVADVLRESGLEPRNLILEITESTMMEDVNTSVAALKRLKNLGVRIAADDFGKDYSSLSYLRRLPIDILKIDRSLVGGIGTDSMDEWIVKAVIDLARPLDLEVVAEGVEDGEQLAYLREVECQLAQGFYIRKPVPTEEVNELLTTYNYS